MWNFLGTLANWFDRINRALAAIACAMMVMITLAICIEIFTRTFLDLSNPWLVELSEITLLYLTFLAAAWVLGNDKHVSIDLLVGYMGRRLAGSLQFALSWFAAAACFIVCWFGILTVIDQFQAEIREPTIMAPLTYWITAIVPFGLLLLGFQFLRRGLRALLGMPLAVAGKRDGGHA